MKSSLKATTNSETKSAERPAQEDKLDLPKDPAPAKADVDLVDAEGGAVPEAPEHAEDHAPLSA